MTALAKAALPTELTWTRTPPDAEGWWLRINVVGSPTLHLIRRWPSDSLLHIDWGYDAPGSLTLPHHKLEGWWWYGPVSLPASTRPSTNDDARSKTKGPS